MRERQTVRCADWVRKTPAVRRPTQNVVILTCCTEIEERYAERRALMGKAVGADVTTALFQSGRRRPVEPVRGW